MKKCPYCAEEIQDEAIICRYCHSELIPQAIKIHKQDAIYSEDLKPNSKKYTNVFWRALLFGVFMGLLLFFYNINKPNAFPSYGDDGHFNDAFFKGLSSVFIYGFIYSFVVWLFRCFQNRSKNIKVFSTETGFTSMLIFIALIALFFIVLFIGIPKAQIPKTLVIPTQLDKLGEAQPQLTNTQEINVKVIPKVTKSSPVENTLPLYMDSNYMGAPTLYPPKGENCTLWSKITKYDIGSKVCVYGNVTYSSSNRITFGTNTNEIFVYIKNNSYKVGDCVKVIGEVVDTKITFITENYYITEIKPEATEKYSTMRKWCDN